MKYIDMSYKGVGFKANPERMRLKMARETVKNNIPFLIEKTSAGSERAAVISGSGSFVGEDMHERANMLMTAFKSRGSAFLFAPAFSPLRVFFTELEISLDAMKNCINYSFVFTEDTAYKKRYREFDYTRARRGENVFDVANRCSRTVDELVKCNDFKNLFSLKEGDKIWLK